MKVERKNLGILTILLLMCMLITFAGYKSAVVSLPTVTGFKLVDTSWTKQKATAWFNRKEWLHGLSLKPHASIDQLQFAREYAANKSRWDKAFAYLKNTDLTTIKVGHYQIEGEDVYANVTDAPSKEFDQTQYEAHRNYSDIHYMISGKEKIGVAPFSATTVKTPYDAAKDIGFYTANGKIYTGQPGTFFIFCPGNAHRPTIKVAGENSVKKIVIKIKVAGK